MSKLLRSAMLAAGAVCALGAAWPEPALAWYRGGVVIGVAPFPFVVGPPVVYAPPPAYYYPPPVAYAPPPSPRNCFAGNYSCPLPLEVPPGAACSCPANGGGLVGGRAG